MEPSSEESNSWTSAELRKHETLTLSSDVSILKCMQKISANILSKTNAVMKELDTLEQDTATASIKVENCIQNLNIMSSKQYMEKRVYDEEVAEKKEETLNSIDLPASSIDIIPKVREALSYGLPATRNMDYQTSEEANFAGNCYSNRSLPYILGSEKFFECQSVETVTVAKTDVSCGNKMIPSPEPEIVAKHTPFQIVSTGINSLPLDSESPSLKSCAESVENASEDKSPGISTPELHEEVPSQPIEDKIPVKPSLVNLHAELTARLKVSATNNDKSAVTSESSREETGSSLPVEDNIIEKVQRSPAFKPPVNHQPKKKNLFDDSSNSDDDDLFKVASRKNVLPPVLKSSPINSSHPLPRVPVTLKTLPATNIGPTGGSNAVVGNVSQKGRPSNVKSLFDASDSDEDIFASHSVLPQPDASVKSLKSTMHVSEVEEEDIFDQKKQQTNIQEKAASQPSGIQSRVQSLFSDDDDDDDLLNWLPSRKTASRKNSIVIENHSVTQPLQANNPKESSLFSDSDSDEDLFSTGPPTPVPSRPFINEPKEIVEPVRKLLKVLSDPKVDTEISADPSFDYDSPVDSLTEELSIKRSRIDSLKISSAKRPSSMSPFRATPSPLADDNDLLKKVGTPEEPETPQAESTPTSDHVERPTNLIASLKLSLSKRPNGPNFSTPSTANISPITPNLDGNPTSGSRKPFGGVALFSPISPITPPVSSSISSDPVEDSSASQTDNESLMCLGKSRPRAPNTRRPQSRIHRRSMILEEGTQAIDPSNKNRETTGHNNLSSLPDVTGLDLDATVSEIAEISASKPEIPNSSDRFVKDEKPKLFSDESDSSDGELFTKPITSKASSIKKMDNERTKQKLVPFKNDEDNAAIVKPSYSLFGESSDSDDGLFRSQVKTVPNVGKFVSPLSADSDNDDLLKRPTERREVAQSKKQDSTRDYGRREAVSSDPLQGLHE